jgi:lysine 2,3-aminomutase
MQTSPAASAASANLAPGTSQPFKYPLERQFVEPDWTRIPGYRSVTKAEWETALWQRKHTIKNLKELKAALGSLLPESLAASIDRDQRERATMSILLTPHMVNTMNMDDLWNDPLRRYMLPAFDDRHTVYPNHPKASRDSLHEAEMWKVEGLTHRYPTKVLAELLSTCPQYCGHCTRMDLVGNDTTQVDKLKFKVTQPERWTQMLPPCATSSSRAETWRTCPSPSSRASSASSSTFPTFATFAWPRRA